MLSGSKCLLLLEASVHAARECADCSILCEFQATACHLLNVWVLRIERVPGAHRLLPPSRLSRARLTTANHHCRSRPWPSGLPPVPRLSRVLQATRSTGQPGALGKTGLLIFTGRVLPRPLDSPVRVISCPQPGSGSQLSKNDDGFALPSSPGKGPCQSLGTKRLALEVTWGP